MSIIEQATKRLETLSKAGVSIPWNLTGIAVGEMRRRIDESSEDARAAADRAPSPIASPKAPSIAATTEIGPSWSRPLREPKTVSLDLERLERIGHLVPTGTRSRLSEEFRHIKRPLLENARAAQPQERQSLIMVTSALPAEGKTYCAINLARSMALEIDTSVILVDADVLRPGVLDRLGIPSPQKGLLDVLTQANVDFDDVLLKTNVPKLSILPAGTNNARSSELLASEAMDRLLQRLLEEYSSSIVVFDAPPLLPTMEAKVLASHMGQIILVVEASRTPRRAVERALGFIDRCPCVMTVLNKAEEPLDNQGYADYYG